MNDRIHGIILETFIRTLKLEAFFTMTAAKTAAAMAVGLLTTLSVASFAQYGQDQPATANPTANATALVLDELATVDWIEKSDVAALREGVIEKMELRLGDPALVSKPIGYLHREAAELTVADAQIQEATENQAVAKAELALAQQILKEHTIVAPFDGVVIKRMKN